MKVNIEQMHKAFEAEGEAARALAAATAERIASTEILEAAEAKLIADNCAKLAALEAVAAAQANGGKPAKVANPLGSNDSERDANVRAQIAGHHMALSNARVREQWAIGAHAIAQAEARYYRTLASLLAAGVESE